MRKRVVCVLLVVFASAAPAAAKEGVQAHLLKPVPSNARAGSFVTVRWTVTVRGPHRTREGFSAIGMVVRLDGAGGVSTTAVARENVGPPYSARVRVPIGGIRAIRFGVAGSNGIVFFPIRP
jgi:hypothetical protein